MVAAVTLLDDPRIASANVAEFEPFAAVGLKVAQGQGVCTSGSWLQIRPILGGATRQVLGGFLPRADRDRQESIGYNWALPDGATMPALDAPPSLSSRARQVCTGTVCAVEIVEVAVRMDGTLRCSANDEDVTSPARLHAPLTVVSASAAAVRGPIARDLHHRSQQSGLRHWQEAETITENAHFQLTPSLRQAPPSRISALR